MNAVSIPSSSPGVTTDLSVAAPPNIARLRSFVQQLATLVESLPGESELRSRASDLLAELVAHDDWLPAEYAQPSPERYQQYLLHADALGRFSVVSFVWGPGQATPIHDHTVWGLIGMLRGAEDSQSYERNAATGRWVPCGAAHRLLPGKVEAVTPNDATIGDVHRVSNALPDATSISIHVYGANIGAVQRSVFQQDGTRKLFISGYSNTTLPNLWDLFKNPAPAS
jgi:predicted metal-dependent enzyme (double-stranded beta helix superfamily)